MGRCDANGDAVERGANRAALEVLLAAVRIAGPKPLLAGGLP
jgi:hypothetical protein